MNVTTGRKIAILGSVLALVFGVVLCTAVGKPVAYGAAPANATNILQTLFGGGLTIGGIISTVTLVLKKFGVTVPDGASVAVERLIDDFRKGKTIDVAEDTVLTSALMFRVKAKDAAGIDIATKLIQHVMVNGGKVASTEFSK